jgi:hypothetical protein
MTRLFARVPPEVRRPQRLVRSLFGVAKEYEKIEREDEVSQLGVDGRVFRAV